MTALWTAAEAAQATSGQAIGAWQVNGISIDTRTLQPGDLFVALSAARDGHDFVAQALAQGAGAALVSRRPEGVAEDAPLLLVADVLQGLEALGRAARARSHAKIIAVTGSVGKTSTKEMLRKMLASAGRLHVAEASYNNHWGVPLTLARMPAATDVAVFEIGMNHPGEIAPLAKMVAPHIAMITTVAPAHLAAFGGIEGIAREKAAIFEGLVAGGVAVLPADLETSAILRAGAEAAGAAQIVTFDAGGLEDWTLSDLRPRPDVVLARAKTPLGEVSFKLSTPGAHFASNALGALAVAVHAGVDLALAIGDLGRWAPPSGRRQRERIALDSLDEELYFELIDDAFNANPASMKAALDVFALLVPRDGIGRIEKGRRIAILGDMLELGPEEIAHHAALAEHPAMAEVSLVHCVGPRMRALWQALPQTQRGEWHESAEALVARVSQLADAGDVILVKGSKSIKVSAVVDALRKLGQGRGLLDLEGL